MTRIDCTAGLYMPSIYFPSCLILYLFYIVKLLFHWHYFGSELNKACCQPTDKLTGCSVFSSVSSVMHSTQSIKLTEDRKQFMERSVATLKVCLCSFDGCRKDDYILCGRLNVLAQQGEPLPEAFQPSVATASTWTLLLLQALFH